MMDKYPIVSVKNLTKKYHLYDSPKHRLKEALHPFRRKYHRDFWALKGVSFDVMKGDTLGILGKNGSGKSTLLKIITGVLTPTSGNIAVNGSVSALLELGAGFNPELTGIENVYLSSAIMGYTRQEIDLRLDNVLSFADIGDFVYQPIKNYSSGMTVRLAFASAISVEPDILIIDEALSVGDVFFQQKCFSKIREMISGGTTCLFVSHDTTAIMNICNRAVLLDNGEMVFDGAPEETASRYFSRLGTRQASRTYIKDKKYDTFDKDTWSISPADICEHNILTGKVRRHGKGDLEIVAARVVDKYGLDTLKVQMLEPLIFIVLLRAKKDIYAPSSGIHIYDRLGNLVFATGSRQLKCSLPDLLAGRELIVKMEITFNVQPGEYTFSLGAAEPSDEGPNVGYLHDRHEMLGPVIVMADENAEIPFFGIAQLPMSVSFYVPALSANT